MGKLPDARLMGERTVRHRGQHRATWNYLADEARSSAVLTPEQQAEVNARIEAHAARVERELREINERVREAQTKPNDEARRAHRRKQDEYGRAKSRAYRQAKKEKYLAVRQMIRDWLKKRSEQSEQPA